MTRKTSGTTAPRRSATARQHTPAQRPAPAPRDARSTAAPAAPAPRDARSTAAPAAPAGDGGADGTRPGSGATGPAERTPAAARPSSVAFYAPHHHGHGPAAHRTGPGLRP
ncbi:hypothetical protein KBZ10_00900 [Streptomyces sp. F63]|uniref:hypothetical protein n=1 Tax=Streptomyces sp. F63 TaxID=2824887 RepID=UPI001B3768CC|nr:hypothetical protein [Streptomyces sp. F63]MBQ0983119.1 hypothetical protein [Streptomyces sp. F63]